MNDETANTPDDDPVIIAEAGPDLTTWGMPIYARFEDDSDCDPFYERRFDHKVRDILVCASPDGLLLIQAKNRRYGSGDYRPGRFTREQAARLRDAIDRYLADDPKPAPVRPAVRPEVPARLPEPAYRNFRLQPQPQPPTPEPTPDPKGL